MKSKPERTPNQQLKRERELRGWSQQYVAEQIGADRYYLSRWEHGVTAPSPYYRQKLCTLFGKNAQELGLLGEEASGVGASVEVQTVLPRARISDPAIPPPFSSSYHLVGRAELLFQLKQRLFSTKHVALSALNGIPGVGKTSLALVLAYDEQVLAHFHDGIFWAGLGPQPNLLRLLSHWGALLGIDASERANISDVREWTRVIHAAISDRLLLFVLDDVWTLEDALALKVGGPNCAYLLTTRFPQLAHQFALEGASVVEELDEEDSLALLGQLVPDFITQQPQEARELVRLVSGLPLALLLVGKYLRAQTYSGQLRRLHTALQRLREPVTRLQLSEPQAQMERSLSLPADQAISLENLINVSDQLLDESARTALRALAIFPAKPHSFSEEAALVVGNVSAEMLDRLSDAGLLEVRGPARYALHQTIADYARARLVDEMVYSRFTGYYADYTETHTNDFAALDREFVNIDAALTVAFERDLSADQVCLANNFAHFLDARGLFAQADIYLQRARAAAERLQDNDGLSGVLLNVGIIRVRQGNYSEAEACLQEGLLRVRETGNHGHLIGLLQALGMLFQRQGKHVEAQEHLQAGLTLARAAADSACICSLLKNLGTLAAIQGHYEQASVYWLESLDLARQQNDREAVCLLLLNLGQVASERHDIADARQSLLEALSIARQIGHQDALSLVLTNLGVLAGDQQDYLLAEQYLQEGLLVARAIGYRERIGLLLTNLGWISSEQEKDSEAAAYFQESLALAYEIGYQWLISGTLRFLGDLQLKQKQFAEAASTFREALTRAAEGNQRMKGEALFGLARVSEAQGDTAEARRQGEASLAILEAIGQGFASDVRQWLQAHYPAE